MNKQITINCRDIKQSGGQTVALLCSVSGWEGLEGRSDGSQASPLLSPARAELGEEQLEEKRRGERRDLSKFL